MNTTTPTGIFLATLLLSACSAQKAKHDASGVFEAREIIISAEIAGQIIDMPVQEGQSLQAQELAAQIDCKQLELQRAQITASDVAITERTTEAEPQIDILKKQERAVAAQLNVQRQQLSVLKREQKRFSALVAAKAAPAKQLEDIEGQIAVLHSQMNATSSQIAISRQQRTSYSAQVNSQNRATSSARGPARAQLDQIDDQISKCRVINPIAGTVLTKYAEQFEFATPGKPMYKIADLSDLLLRAYITGDQLPSVKLNQNAKVFVDDGPDKFRELSGKLVWVSDKAEFTPKTIQTNSERSNLVYAVKIRVPNDGTLKIGMYAEVSFQ